MDRHAAARARSRRPGSSRTPSSWCSRGADRGIQGDDEHHYARSLTVEAIARGEVLLAYEMNGRPLEPQHGFPLRLLVPGWYGMTSVKWLDSIEAVTEPFEGYQQYVAYRYQRDAPTIPGEPVSRIRVRALMIPPGRPDFFSRERFGAAGPTTVFGRAWSGAAPVERVELAVDGAVGRRDARARRWAGTPGAAGRTTWDATPGEHELACRATDADGEHAAAEPPWNYQGMGNNGVQRVAVTVA